MKRYCFLLLIGLAVAACKPVVTSPVSFSSALQNLTDASRLASPPTGRAFMVSSYDRTGSNADSRNFQGTDSVGDYILVDLKGPGCLSRLWFTGIPETARFYFYFDEEAKPRLSLTVSEMKTGTSFPFIKPLCEEPSGAIISYVPLPYAKRLKITVSPGQKNDYYYYQINYTSFPPHTPTTTFLLPLSEEESNRFEENLRTWQHPETLYTLDLSRENSITIPPGTETVLFSTNKPGLITEWACMIPEGGSPQATVLPSQLVLNMYWDGMSRSSVQVPLGDFFCNPLRPREFNSALLSRSGKTYRARMPLPFRKGARITLTNQSGEPVIVRFSMKSAPLSTKPVFYFHAEWNQSTRSGRPFRLTQVDGNGYFIGTSLLEYATGRVSWNILEGDELFTVDQDAKCAFYGTGLEDYFNGGWYYNGGTFLAPLSGVTDRSAVKTAQYRFHLDAPIPFKKQFTASFEFGHGNASDGYFSGTAYWYQNKPSAVKNLPSAAIRRHPPDPLEQQAFMCEIFETERKENTKEAIALCGEYAARYPGTPGAKMFLLRARAYQAYLHPEQAVQLIPDEQGSSGEQADLLKKFYADPKSALISANVNGAYTLYLDGMPLLQGNNMAVQQAVLTSLLPGTHALMMKVQWIQPDNWINVHLRTHTTNLWSGTDWECAQQPDAPEWSPCVIRGVLPKMSWIHFEPNAMVYTQHHMLIGPQPGWDEPGKTCYFRKKLTIMETP